MTLALIIATIKGSMVAAVFMHLNHEKPWIYGSLLLTVIGFLRADVGPDVHDDGQHRHAHPRAGSRWRPPKRGTKGTDMSLRAFHLVFIVLSVVLAAFMRGVGGRAIPAGAGRGLSRDGPGCRSWPGAGLTMYRARFQRKTRNL